MLLLRVASNRGDFFFTMISVSLDLFPYHAQSELLLQITYVLDPSYLSTARRMWGLAHDNLSRQDIEVLIGLLVLSLYNLGDRNLFTVSHQSSFFS